MMHIELLTFSQLKRGDIEKYVSIWNSEFPITISRLTKESFYKKVQNKEIIFLVARNKNSDLVGFLELQKIDENVAWFIMAIHKKYQLKGIGSKLIKKAKELVKELHGWIIPPGECLFKQDFSLYRSPLLFYKKNDFAIGKMKRTKKGSYLEIIWKRE